MKTKRILTLIALGAALALPQLAEAQFPGFGGAPGGAPGGRTGGSTRTRGSGGTGSSAALQAQSKVVAVADERSNSLIILAPEDQIPMLEELIKELDGEVDDVTEVKIIKLKYADPTEVAEQVNQLFGSSTQNQNNQQGSRFGPTAFFSSRFGGQPGGGAAGNNDRGKRSTQEVMAVADPRTASLIISAPRQMMATVEQLVTKLDSSPDKKQGVFVFSLEHADVNATTEILRSLFEGENSRTLQNNTQDTALRSRQGTFGTAGAANTTTGGAGRGGAGAGGIGRR